jgi:hemolysin activation/secretion protein
LDAAWVTRQFEVNGLLDTPIGADRVLALINIINRVFLDNGYINSGVLLEAQNWPAPGGPLRLNLVSGRIVSVAPNSFASVTWGEGGHRGLGPDYIVDRLPAAKAAPFNAADLEREFRLLAEDSALRTVNASLQPGSAPGEAQLDLTVDPQPRYDVYLSVANSRSPSVGGERASIGGSMRNVVFDGDQFSAEYGVTEGLSDAIVSYQTPFLSPRNIFDARAEYNDANVVDTALRPLDIASNSISAAIGVTHTFVQRPLLPKQPGTDGTARWRAAREVSGGLRIAYKESEASLLGQPFSFSPGSVDGRSEITVARLTGDWIERSDRQVVAVSATLSNGLDGTGSDIVGVVRPNPHFTAALVQINYARKLTDRGLELRARLAGQWASGLLYTAERFSAGGESTVRGYRESLLLADQGALASVELARPFSLSGGRRNARGEDWGTLSATVFADAAMVRNKTPPNPDPEAISSVGISLNWMPSPALSTRLSYGTALTDAGANGDRDLQDDGVNFRITLRPLSLLRGAQRG